MQADLPPTLLATRDHVVKCFHSGLSQPDELRKIQEWLEADGWDDLLNSCGERCINSSTLCLSDDELCSNSDLADTLEKINNSMRLQYGRQEISKQFSDKGYAYATSDICSYELKDDSGNAVIIGCLIESVPGGASAAWIGLFRNQNDFYNYLRSTGSILSSDLHNLSDRQILALWEPPHDSTIEDTGKDLSVTNDALASWIEQLWANDYFRYELMSSKPEITSIERITDRSLKVKFQFWDDQHHASDSQSCFMFDLKYAEEYGVNFPACLLQVNQTWIYTWKSEGDLIKLSNDLVHEEFIEQEIHEYEWDDPEISDSQIEDYVSGIDREGMKAMLLEKYNAALIFPSQICTRLAPYFLEILNGTSPLENLAMSGRSRSTNEISENAPKADFRTLRIKIVTGKVRFINLHGFNPQVIDGDEVEYSATLLLNKSDCDTIRRINDAINQLESSVMSSHRLLSSIHSVRLVECGSVHDNLNGADYLQIEAKSPVRPGIVDVNMNPVLDRTFIDGCWGRASLTFHAVVEEDGVGIACRLNNIQSLMT